MALSDKRVAPLPDARLLQQIRVDFGMPVHITSDQDRRLFKLIDEIVMSDCNQPVDGVHWLAGHGSMPCFSQADAIFLGKSPDPAAPAAGEPTFDDNVLSFECVAREFVSDKERESTLQRRETKAVKAEVAATFGPPTEADKAAAFDAIMSLARSSPLMLHVDLGQLVRAVDPGIYAAIRHALASRKSR